MQLGTHPSAITLSPVDAAAWLAEVQAALDATFWTLRGRHVSNMLTPPSPLYPALRCLNALLASCTSARYVTRQA